jgi:hypothetical protein
VRTGLVSLVSLVMVTVVRAAQAVVMSSVVFEARCASVCIGASDLLDGVW